MAAGKPDWGRLQEINKLPKGQRHQVPYLGELKKAEERLDKIEKGCCDECRAKFFKKEQTREPVRTTTTPATTATAPKNEGSQTAQ